MTDLRKAAEQALEVLEQIQGGCTDSDDGTVEAITVWCPEVIEDLRAALAAEQAPDAVSAERDRWETAIGAVMPPDFKDWHQNCPSERPEIAAWVISNLRADRDSWADQASQRTQDALDLVAAERDCRTCRHFRGTDECHSVLRCVDGSSYRRGGVVRLWEPMTIDQPTTD